MTGTGVQLHRRHVGHGRPGGSTGRSSERLASAQEAALFGRPTSKHSRAPKRMAAASAQAPAASPPAETPGPPALAAAPPAPFCPGPAPASCARTAGSNDNSRSTTNMSEGRRAVGGKGVLDSNGGRSTPSARATSQAGQKQLPKAVVLPPPQQQQPLHGAPQAATPGLKPSRLSTSSSSGGGGGGNTSSFNTSGAAFGSAPNGLGVFLEQQQPRLVPLVSCPHQLQQSRFLPLPPPIPGAAGGAPAPANVAPKAAASGTWMWAQWQSAGVAPAAEAEPESMQMEAGPAAWAAPAAAADSWPWAAVQLSPNHSSSRLSRTNGMAAAASTAAQGIAEMSLVDAMQLSCTSPSLPAWAPAASSDMAWAPAAASWLALEPAAASDMAWVPAASSLESGWPGSMSSGSSTCAWEGAASYDDGVADMQWEYSGSVGASPIISAPAAGWSSRQPHCRRGRRTGSSSSSGSMKRTASAVVADTREAAARGSGGAVTPKLKQTRR